MPYILARALIDGKLGLETFTDEAIRDSEVHRLAEKIHMEVDPDVDVKREGDNPCKVVIRSKDGRTFSRRVDYPKGSPQAPLTPQELRKKFVECARRALSEKVVGQVLEYLDRLERLENLNPLCQLLMGEAGQKHHSATGFRE